MFFVHIKALFKFVCGITEYDCDPGVLKDVKEIGHSLL